MIRRRYRIALGFGLLVAAIVVACQDDPTSPRGPGSISLEIVLADDSLAGPGLMASSEGGRVLLFGSLDRARAHARGPTNKTVDLTHTQDDYFEGTITGLQPGSYSVAVEGLIGNEVDYYGVTTVSVSAGQNSTASITFRSFVPNLTTVPTRTASRRFEVCYSSVSNATGYRVEWANNPSFAGLNSAQSSSTCAEVQVTAAGTYYLRVRALEDMSSTPSAPSDVRTVDVVAAVAAVAGTVTGAEENDIRAGGATLVLTLTDDQWVTGIGSNNTETTALLDGLVSNGSESHGWNAIVRPGLNFSHVARLSATQVRLTLPQFPEYWITLPETITVTVPAVALVASIDAAVAEPAFTISLSPRIVVSVTGEGSVTSNPGGIDCPTDCSQGYGSGTEVTLNATPAAGWGLQTWGGACTGTGLCRITLVQDTTVSATFVQGQFDLSVAVNGNGSVSSDPAGIDCGVDCSEIYASGTEVTLTATPAAGWLFFDWSGDCSGTNATTTVTMNSAKGCTATFVEQMFQLNVLITGSGAVTSDPAGIACPDGACQASYPSGKLVTLTAEPAPGWGFSNWSGDCSGANPIVQVTMDAARTCQATFIQVTYALGVTVEGTGGVGSNPAGITCPGDCIESYPSGTQVTLTAVPEPGWIFSQWSGDCAGGELTVVVTMDADKTCTATFVEQTFQLNVSITGSGAVTSDPAGIACPDGACQASYPSGNLVTLTAEPAPGWEFSNWSGDCSGANPIVQVTMDAARTCQATFIQVAYALGVTVEGTGGVASNPAGITCPGDCIQSYPSGTQVTLTAVPEPGWIFSQWSGDCAGGELSVIVTMDADKACTATFVEEYFPLTVEVTGGGSVTSDPAGITCPDDCGEPFLNGSTVTLTATPDEGWLLEQWEGDCSGSELTASVTMDAAKTCFVTFIRETFPLEVTIVGHARGGGIVTSDPVGIDCGEDCFELYDSGTQVTLIATPAPDDFWSAFSHWTGDCSGTEPKIVVTMDGGKVCGATFVQAAAEITVSVAGAGIVTSQPAGIDCPDNSCSAAYSIPTQVTLTATPRPGWLFWAWGGDCSGTEPTLGVAVQEDVVCSATFVVRPEWFGVPVQTTLPEPRGEHTAVYVAPTNEMVVFGGVTEGGVRLNDLWYLSNANGLDADPPAWRQEIPGGVPPAVRNNHTAVYDPASDRMIVYGGFDGVVGEPLDDVWILTEVSGGGGEWYQLDPDGRGDPSLSRHGHTAVYDPDSNRMIVFGGESLIGPEFYPVWVLTNANGIAAETPTWVRLDYGCRTPCVAPPAVLDHTAIYDDVNNLMVTFGGTDYNYYFDETYVYLNADALNPSETYFLPYYVSLAPNGRYGHTTTYDPASNIMTLYGGIMGIVLGPRGAGPAQQADDPTIVWRLLDANNRNTAVWERIDAIGEPPPSRSGHTAVWDPLSNHMMVFGGFEFFSGTPLNDLWILTKANGQLQE